MGRFLVHKRNQVVAGELAPRTMGEYFEEVTRFVEFMKLGTPASGLRPEHFSAYMQHLVRQRKLGRHARKRVRAYVNCLLHFGSKNGWYAMPPTGIDWIAPATDVESMRVARARAGVEDHSDRIVTGTEARRLLKRASPTFRALILLGLNCGLGPADLARLRWKMFNLGSGRMIYPRHKTGVMRVGYLWKSTRKALRRLRTLKYNRLALERDGDRALVFVTRENRPLYREVEVFKEIVVDGQLVRKLAGVRVENAVSNTFGRMCRDLSLQGVSFYRLRHTFRTLGARARDREALDAMTGHKDRSTAGVYQHETVSWTRVKRVALRVRRSLWPASASRSAGIGREQSPASAPGPVVCVEPAAPFSRRKGIVR
jgi:integrase